MHNSLKLIQESQTLNMIIQSKIFTVCLAKVDIIRLDCVHYLLSAKNNWIQCQDFSLDWINIVLNSLESCS